MLLLSCGDEVPVITVQGDFEIESEPKKDYCVGDSVFHYLSIRDARSGVIKGYVKIGRTIKEDKEGAQ